MKVLLINPPLRTNVPSTLYPIGICYVASFLKAHGHSVKILDVNGYRWSKSEFIEKLKEQDFDAVGVGGLVTAFNHVSWISDNVRRFFPRVPIFAGNTVASTIPQILLKHTCVDIAVIGEGEETAVDLVNALEEGRELASVKGIYYKSEDNIIKTPERPPIADLDSLPYPAWDLVPMKIYIENFKNCYGFVGTSLSTVRGCPYNCSFCCKGFIGYKVRSRSAESIIEEIEELERRYRIEGFTFVDDLFTYDCRRTERFCDLMVEKKLNRLKWMCSSRANLFSTDIAKKLKQAGCISVGFGFESHSQKVLDYYNKRCAVADQKRVVDICRSVGIRFEASYIVGAANEDEQSLRETFLFCERNGISYLPNNLLMPQPQTKIYREAIERGLIPDEYDYLKKIADAGDTDVLVLNMTKFSDEKLVNLFQKYRMMSRSSNKRLKQYIADIRTTLFKLRRYGVKVCVDRLVNVISEKDIKNFNTARKQQRNTWE
jgi:radical SAM superfamily enzyme YgiQ (UPF0313 family)